MQMYGTDGYVLTLQVDSFLQATRDCNPNPRSQPYEGLGAMICDMDYRSLMFHDSLAIGCHATMWQCLSFFSASRWMLCKVLEEGRGI